MGFRPPGDGQKELKKMGGPVSPIQGANGAGTAVLRWFLAADNPQKEPGYAMNRPKNKSRQGTTLPDFGPIRKEIKDWSQNVAPSKKNSAF